MVRRSTGPAPLTENEPAPPDWGRATSGRIRRRPTDQPRGSAEAPVVDGLAVREALRAPTAWSRAHGRARERDRHLPPRLAEVVELDGFDPLSPRMPTDVGEHLRGAPLRDNLDKGRRIASSAGSAPRLSDPQPLVEEPGRGPHPGSRSDRRVRPPQASTCPGTSARAGAAVVGGPPRHHSSRPRRLRVRLDPLGARRPNPRACRRTPGPSSEARSMSGPATSAMTSGIRSHGELVDGPRGAPAGAFGSTVATVSRSKRRDNTPTTSGP